VLHRIDRSAAQIIEIEVKLAGRFRELELRALLKCVDGLRSELQSSKQVRRFRCGFSPPAELRQFIMRCDFRPVERQTGQPGDPVFKPETGIAIEPDLGIAELRCRDAGFVQNRRRMQPVIAQKPGDVDERQRSVRKDIRKCGHDGPIMRQCKHASLPCRCGLHVARKSLASFVLKWQDGKVRFHVI
jgi:hypothetical protein